MGPWALARMARFILTEPRASPDTRDKGTAARAGPEIVAVRAAPAPNSLPLTISLRDEVAFAGSARLFRSLFESNRADTIPIAVCYRLRQQGLYGRSRYAYTGVAPVISAAD
jgi:hypothetical protein